MNQLHKTNKSKCIPFYLVLRNALKSYADPQKLGNESPLATPYFLGRALEDLPKPVSAQERGQILCEEIREAAASLWGGSLPRNRQEIEQVKAHIHQQACHDPHYAYLVLELQYFQEFFKPRRQRDIWECAEYLPSSKATFHRHVGEAEKILGKALLDRLRPTLRLEAPPITATRTGYRTEELACLDALQKGQTVSLNGTGGVGKTTVGAALVSTGQPTFWFTVRPTLNDQLASLLFSLGHFLHQQGASKLWQHIVVDAEHAVKDLHLVLSMVSEDLATLKSNPPILCFDEIDCLQGKTTGQKSLHHAQILEFLESIRGHAAMLLISQSPLLESDLYITLNGLDIHQTSNLLRKAGILYTRDELSQLYAYTGGNPRLLTFTIALTATGVPLSTAVDKLPDASAHPIIVNRLWSRLNALERDFLGQLAVFRGFAPADLWAECAEVLQRFINDRLVQHDGLGGVALLPALRDLIYRKILSDHDKKYFHVKAAHARTTRAEYTSATYHYVQAGEANHAIHLWDTCRHEEIQRGQAGVALAILEQIARPELGKGEGRTLALLCAELHQLQGSIETGRTHLDAEEWSDGSEESVRAKLLRGDFLDILGYPEKAVDAYKEGADTLMGLLNQLGNTHYKRGMVHVRQKEMQAAWHEAQRAEFNTQSLYGVLYEEEGNYLEAHEAYLKALNLAQRLDDHFYLAESHRHLANVALRLQRCTEAIEHAHHALESYAQIGDRPNVEGMHDTLASIYFQMGQFTQVVEKGHQAFTFFKTIKDPYRCANIAATLSEAYFELGDLENAQRYAFESLEQEQPQASPYALYTLGRVKQAEQRLTDAERFFTNSLKTARRNRDNFIAAYAQRELGSVYLAQGDVQSAKQACTEAIQVFTRLGIEEEMVRTKERLARCV